MNYLDTHSKMLDGHGIPADYSFWSALWCVGSVVGRSAYINSETRPIFLNPIVTMVSSKGLAKERMLIDVCADIVGKASVNNSVIKDGTISTALLRHTDAFGVGMVAVARPGFPLVGRASSILHLSGYANSLPLNYAPNPHVTILTCHTPDYLRRVRTELWPDFLMVSRKTAPVTAFGAVDITTAVDDLRVIKRNAKAITLAAEAAEFLSNYFSTVTFGTSSYEQETAAVLPIHIKRTAGLVALCQSHEHISRLDVVTALNAILKAQRYGIYLYADGSGSAITGARLLRSTLQNGKPYGHKALYQQVRHVMPAHEFNKIMSVMIAYNAVTMYRIKGFGRTYIATGILNNDGIWMEILRDAGYGYETEG